jgi:hypothetical protein
LLVFSQQEGVSMHTVAGVFARRSDAEHAVGQLGAIGVPRPRISLLAPGGESRQVPTDEGERPGMGATIGAVVGGATGAAVGLPLGAAMTLLVPGVGAVVAFGAIGAMLLGAGGAAVGAALEDNLVTGLPRDELFVYEDALRRGHTVVVAMVDDDALADSAREALVRAGAETIDVAREQWWLGLRSAELEHYPGGAPAFERDELLFRRGFEAALTAESRSWSWEEAVSSLRARDGADADAPAYRAGWERGQEYRRRVGIGAELKKSA